jgi:hypothetical protein
MEEARHRLKELGAQVLSPSLAADEYAVTLNVSPGAALYIGDNPDEARSESRRHIGQDIPIVCFSQRSGQCRADFLCTDDFSTSLYFAIWASIER